MDHQQHEFNQQFPSGAPEAWGEPVVIGSDEAVADETPTGDDDRFAPTEIGVGDIEHTAGVAATSAPDTPGHSGEGSDDVPPEIPGTPEVQEQPNRGEALRTVLAHANTSTERIHDRLRGLVIDNAERLDLGRHLEDEDVGRNLDETVEYLGTTKGLEVGRTIKSMVLIDDLVEAEAAYSEALEAVGARFGYRNQEELMLEIINPEAYAEAVEQLQTAELTEEELENFHRQAFLTVDDAMQRAPETIVANNQPEALAICGGAVPDFDEFVRTPGAGSTSPESTAFAASLAENAGRIAAVFEALGTPDFVVAPLRQLAIAQTEGLTTEWAVGISIEVIGQSDTPAGIGRLTTPQNWEPVLGYLTHLQTTAPDAAFTEEVRSTLLGDIYTSVLNPPGPNWLGEVHSERDTYQAFLSAMAERIIEIMPREY
jgi:hypothetical protein